MFKWLIEKKLDDFAQDVDFASFKKLLDLFSYLVSSFK